MHLIVQSLNSAIVVNVERNASLSDIKAAIEDVEFIPSAIMRLVKNSTELVDDSLDGLIEDGDLLNLLIDVSGGMRAKWRKKRMRRLRRKRRKMRSRAR